MECTKHGNSVLTFSVLKLFITPASAKQAIESPRQVIVSANQVIVSLAIIDACFIHNYLLVSNLDPHGGNFSALDPKIC